MSPVHPAFAFSALSRGLFWFSYIAWLGSEAWILSRDRRPASGEARDRGSRRIIGVGFAAGLIAAFATGTRLRFGRIGLAPEILLALGLALMWGGVAFRLWAVATLGRFFRTKVMVLDDHRLIRTGPYRWLRNPSYTGTVVTLMGIGVAIGNWVSLALLLGCALPAYAWRIEVEEDALRRRFGAEHEAYAKARWALIPLVW